VSVWAIVVAGGEGRRFGTPKQFADLHGRPVVAWSVAAARSCADGVVVVLPPERLDEAFGADTAVAGGASRSASVRRGLAAVPTDAEIVVVHDAARPLASPALFAAVLAALEDPAVAGALPGLAVADTLKRVVDDTVVETVDRSALIAVQTPQAFRADVLRSAHAGDPQATDDAALVEAGGATVRVVPGETQNLKLTTPQDLRYCEHLLAQA
jgi:2-C-methyl-D-erythritol 4-phosphate cytidylyltransferase